jgi:large subunit ribosomal protein L13
VRLTGNKQTDKMYYHHSGYIGGIKAKSAKELLEDRPEKIIEQAVWGMLPKNRLGRTMIKKLKVYKGAEHPHRAQSPEILQ